MKRTLSLVEYNGHGRLVFGALALGAVEVPAGDDERGPRPGSSLNARVAVTMERHEWVRLGRPVDVEVDL